MCYFPDNLKQASPSCPYFPAASSRRNRNSKATENIPISSSIIQKWVFFCRPNIPLLVWTWCYKTWPAIRSKEFHDRIWFHGFMCTHVNTQSVVISGIMTCIYRLCNANEQKIKEPMAGDVNPEITFELLKKKRNPNMKREFGNRCALWGIDSKGGTVWMFSFNLFYCLMCHRNYLKPPPGKYFCMQFKLYNSTWDIKEVKCDS